MRIEHVQNWIRPLQVALLGCTCAAAVLAVPGTVATTDKVNTNDARTQTIIPYYGMHIDQLHIDHLISHAAITPDGANSTTVVAKGSMDHSSESFVRLATGDAFGGAAIDGPPIMVWSTGFCVALGLVLLVWCTLQWCGAVFPPVCGCKASGSGRIAPGPPPDKSRRPGDLGTWGRGDLGT